MSSHRKDLRLIAAASTDEEREDYIAAQIRDMARMAAEDGHVALAAILSSAGTEGRRSGRAVERLGQIHELIAELKEMAVASGQDALAATLEKACDEARRAQEACERS